MLHLNWIEGHTLLNYYSSKRLGKHYIVAWGLVNFTKENLDPVESRVASVSKESFEQEKRKGVWWPVQRRMPFQLPPVFNRGSGVKGRQ